MNTGQTLPTNKNELQELLGRSFDSIQKQYKRQLDTGVFGEPQTLPSRDISSQHLFNLCKFCYPSDNACIDLLKKLPQFEAKSKAIDEVKPPSATIQKETIFKEDKETSLLKEINDLRANIKAKNEEIARINKEHTGEIQTYTQKITQAENEKSTAYKVAKERQDTITKLQSDIQTLRTGKENTDKQLQTAQTAQTSISDTVKTLQTNHDSKMSEMSGLHKKEMSEMSAKNAADIADIQKRHAKILADTTQTFNDKLTELENSKNTEGVELRADIADKEKLIAELQARLNKGLLKYRKPTKLEMINILSNVVAAIGFYQLGGVFILSVWALMALFFWDTLLTIKDASNKKSGEFGFWVTVGIEILYGCIHPTTIINAVKNTSNLVADASYYGYLGAIILTLMSIFSLNQSMNKAQDKAS